MLHLTPYGWTYCEHCIVDNSAKSCCIVIIIFFSDKLENMLCDVFVSVGAWSRWSECTQYTIIHVRIQRHKQIMLMYYKCSKYDKCCIIVLYFRFIIFTMVEQQYIFWPHVVFIYLDVFHKHELWSFSYINISENTPQNTQLVK